MMADASDWTEKLESIPGLTPEQIFQDPAAYELAIMLIKVSNLWDDLIDGDGVTKAEINAAFNAALCDIPGNEFYQRHFRMLHGLIQNAIALYLVSNRWEDQRDEHGLELGHVLRYAVVNVIAQIVILARGMGPALEILPHLYKALCDDRVEHYRNEIMSRETSHGQ